jgi:hypothetical protein
MASLISRAATKWKRHGLFTINEGGHYFTFSLCARQWWIRIYLFGRVYFWKAPAWQK